MRGQELPSATTLAGNFQSASAHQGPWPTISVWHGTSDNTVAAENASAWSVHGVETRPTSSERVDGHMREAWQDTSGRDVIELYCIAGMGNATPLDTATGYGNSAPYMLDVGISSTVHIARNWGLTPSFQRGSATTETAGAANASLPKPGASANGMQDIIENALRSPGLKK